MEHKRLLSLDVFRGLTIAGMVLVNSPGNNTAYWPLDHAEWNGMTATDLVFPFFVFIVGVSVVLSLSKRLAAGASRFSLLGQVFKRTAIIFGIGLFLNGFPHFDLSTIRILGVLQRIAICYFFSAAFYLYSDIAVHIGAVVLSLLGYWWVMTHLSAPGYIRGDLSKEGNFAAFIDRLILAPRHMYRSVYDPEGILSTIPAIATGLLGNLAGFWIRSLGTPARKVTGLFQAGFVFLLAGWKWGQFFPLNKALWTSSYVLVTAGWALVLFGLCYYLIEILGWTTWAKPFEVFGKNAIAIYFLHVFFLKLQNLWKVAGPDGTPISIRIAFTNHAFGSWLSPENASLSYALLYVLLWLGVGWWMYRRKIFLKV